MSRPLSPGETPVQLESEAQVKYFAELYRADVKPEMFARLEARTRELGLSFTANELCIIAALDTPDRVQEFLNSQIYYNNDHASVETEETSMPPRRVLQTAHAHCFEGAMFAYTINYLHGHNPRLFLLEASQDSEHNLVLYQNPQTGLYGVNAHSAFPHLDGRPAQYSGPRAIAQSYIPYYYSDRSMDPNDLTLVGYSDPFDLVAKYGVAWMGMEAPLWDLYYTYVDDTVTWHYIFDDPGTPHLYPLIRALKDKWIQVDNRKRPFISPGHLPPAAQQVWYEFWNKMDIRDPRPRGRALELEKLFFKLTGTTPIDMNENVEELRYFLERGYRVEQLLTRDATT